MKSFDKVKEDKNIQNNKIIKSSMIHYDLYFLNITT